MQCHENFLSPRRSSNALWNSWRVADSRFLSEPNMDVFVPHSVCGVVPEDVLDSFVAEHTDALLSATRLKTGMECDDRTKSAEEVVQHLRAAQSSHGFESLEISQAKREKACFLTCPLDWGTGSSFGPTSFREDFADYVKCSTPANDIERTNMAIGIGTTLHKFSLDGEPVHLPCLSCHLPSAAIRLFSPQTYHMLHGGHSAKVVTMIDTLSIPIPLSCKGGNVTLIYNSAYNAK